MKIKQITVTYDDGTIQTWNGIMGYVRVLNIQAKTKPYQRRVTASLLLPPQPEVKPTPVELAGQS